MARLPASVRVRTTISATLTVAAALMISSIGLVTILRSTMTANVDTALRLRATDISAIIQGGNLPDAVAIEGEQDGFVQVVDDSGTVLTSSRNIAGEARLTSEPAGRTLDITNSPVDVGTFRVYVHDTGTADRFAVIVGSSLENVDNTIEVVAALLVLGIPSLVLLVALVTWTVVGHALKPVEAIRAEVADIGGADLHRRVPAPTTHDEIGRLAMTMNAMLDRLEAASDRQRNFVSDASHELRTPIATVRHELDVARADPSVDLEVVLDDITEENQRMQHLVDDLLLLAREDQTLLAAQSSLAKHAIVDLDDLALVEAHRRRPPGPAVDTRLQAEAQIYGDERQITRVLANLVDNAIRHAQEAVRIEIDAGDGTAILHVDDDGPGVAAADRWRIFERFTRADDARSRGDSGGSGLGLAIARDLVSNHGGTIIVTDSPELGGARFTVALPLAVRPH